MPDLLNMSGPDFLRYYFPLVVASVVGAMFLRWWLARDRNDGLTPPVDNKLNPDEVATLASGPRGLADTALAALVNCGAVKLAGGAFKHQGAPPKNGSSVDPLIINTIGDGDKTLRQIRKAVVDSNESKTLVTGLQDRGLLHTDSQKTLLRWLPAVLILVVLALGAGKFALGISRGKPVELLIIIGFFQFAALIVALKSAPFRTHRGTRLLKDLRAENAALEHSGARELEAMAPRDVQLATALFGTAIMAGGLAGLAALISSPSEAYGSSTGCGSSCGSGGGDGGGGDCGGCGGGGD